MWRSNLGPAKSYLQGLPNMYEEVREYLVIYEEPFDFAPELFQVSISFLTV